MQKENNFEFLVYRYQVYSPCKGSSGECQNIPFKASVVIRMTSRGYCNIVLQPFMVHPIRLKNWLHPK